MESFKFNTPEAGGENSYEEQVKKIQEKLIALHDYFHDVIEPLSKRNEEIWKINKDGVVEARERHGWNVDVSEFMPPEQAAEYKKNESKKDSFYDKDLTEITAEVIDLLSSHVERITWKQRGTIKEDPALRGSLQTESYQTKLGEYDVVLITKSNEDVRNNYMLSIHGSREYVTRKGLLGLGRKTDSVLFPGLGVSIHEEESGSYKVHSENADHLSAEDQTRMIAGILKLVESIKIGRG